MPQRTWTTQRLDHLGIVAGVCDRIDLINTIDTFICPTKRKVSVGESVVAMILNALGFVSRPLYLTHEFFSNKPVDLLIRPHLCAADFTMALSLLVYALAERWVRQELKKQDQYLTKSENLRKTQHSDAFFKCLKALMSY